METYQANLGRLNAIGEQIRALSESEVNVNKLRVCLQEAGTLAQSVVSQSHNPDAYYGNHLIRLLTSNAKDTDLYWTYTDYGRRTILFNRCQRYALSDIKVLVEHLESL